MNQIPISCHEKQTIRTLKLNIRTLIVTSHNSFPHTSGEKRDEVWSRRWGDQFEAGACSYWIQTFLRKSREKRLERKKEVWDAQTGFCSFLLNSHCKELDSMKISHSSCNNDEKPTVDRLRNLWESFVLRVVCEPKSQTLVKLYPK